MRTIVRILESTKPRKPLCERLGISVQYASDIVASGKPIGSTETLVRIADELGLTDAELGASAREMCARRSDPDARLPQASNA